LLLLLSLWGFMGDASALRRQQAARSIQPDAEWCRLPAGSLTFEFFLHFDALTQPITSTMRSNLNPLRRL
jgi:hypothetical protein